MKKILACSLIFLLFFSCTNEKTTIQKRFYFSNSKIEIKDSLLCKIINENSSINDTVEIETNLIYEKQILCEQLFYEIRNAFLSNLDTAVIDTTIMGDICLVNMNTIQYEAYFTNTNANLVLDYAGLLKNIYLYPIAINYGILLDSSGNITQKNKYAFSNPVGQTNLNEIYSIGEKIYEKYFENIGFIEYPHNLTQVPSISSFKNIFDFYSYIINNGIIKKYSFIGPGVSQDKSYMFSQHTFKVMNELIIEQSKGKNSGIIDSWKNDVRYVGNYKKYLVSINVKFTDSIYSRRNFIYGNGLINEPIKSKGVLYENMIEIVQLFWKNIDTIDSLKNTSVNQ